MIRKTTLFAVIFTVLIATTGCHRNYYSGTGKGSNCGCPSKRGMVGY